MLPWLPSGICLLLGGCGLGLAWRRRSTLPAADLAVAVAAATTAAALGGPFFNEDKSGRLLLIAAVPGAMTLSFLLAQLPHRGIRRLLGGFVLAAVATGVVLYLPYGGHPTISNEAYGELQEIARILPRDGRSLVVARHGLEWWAAWTLHTHIAQPRAVVAADWSRFEHVYYLVEKRRADPYGPPGGMPQTPRGGPAPFGHGGPLPPGGVPFELQLPDDARTLHDGEQLTFSLVLSRPPQVDGSD